MPKIRDTYSKPPSGWKVTDPLTGVRFEANSYRNLRGKIDTHRKSNGLTREGIDDFIAEQICQKNTPDFCQEWPNLTTRVLQMLGYDGPKLWAELHKRALEHTDGTPDWVWLDQWAEKIPSYGCSCRAKWKEYRKAHPVDWTNYFRWTWAFHEYVNQSLGKPGISLDHARQLWSR